jgi:hypothetical protein
MPEFRFSVTRKRVIHERGLLVVTARSKRAAAATAEMLEDPPMEVISDEIADHVVEPA